MSSDPEYSLALSESEIARYRFMAQLARQTEADQWFAAGLEAGARVADIGCGPGLVLVELADVVGPTGRVIGIDRGAVEVETASKLVAARGLANATVRQGEAWDTGLDHASVDVVNIRHVLAHNSHEQQVRILRHALALLRPGGALYAVDVDVTMIRHDPPDDCMLDLDERYRTHLFETGRDPTVGPRLGSLAASVGFGDVQRFAEFMVLPPTLLAEIRPPAWAARHAMLERGHVSEADIARWDRALTELARTAVDQNRTMFAPTFRIIARRA